MYAEKMDRPDSVFEVVQGVLDEVGAAFSTASDLEKTIWAATSMDVHPPAKQDLTAIAAATHRSYVDQLIHNRYLHKH